MLYRRYYTFFAINQLKLINDILIMIKRRYILNPCVLDNLNCHPRDQYIKFFEEGHRYKLCIGGNTLSPISVTTLIHTYCEAFDADAIIKRMMRSKNWPQSKYYGMFAEEIKQKWDKDRDDAASAGTAMHLNIEYQLNELPVKNTGIEHQYFLNFWNKFKLKYDKFDIYRTEMTVYDETFRNGTAISGSIDALLKDDQDRFIILDWKRSKEIKFTNNYGKMLTPFNDLDDCNYNHYSLQLNIYRHILMTKYNFNVVALMLVILYPSQDDFMCIPVKTINLSSIWSIL